MTYRPIEISLLVHAQVESRVHPSDAHQTYRQADKLQDTWGPTRTHAHTHTHTHTHRHAHMHATHTHTHKHTLYYAAASL